MVQIHLDIKDKEYQSVLAEQLAWRYGEQREICWHHFETEAERQEAMRNTPVNKSLWLVSAGESEDGRQQQANILWMTEEPTNEEEECFCYQPFVQIHKKLTETLYRHHLIERASDCETTCQCIYLYSPFGGIGVSELAYRLAKELSAKEKVLLLSFDAYHNFEQEFISFRLSDLLFYWQTLKQVRIPDFCYQSGNLHILHGPKIPQDLEVLKSRKKRELLQMARAEGYTKIIFDLSSSNMEHWCRPEETWEHFFVIKRLSEKWKQFAATIDFKYIPISEENAFTEIKEKMRERLC